MDSILFLFSNRSNLGRKGTTTMITIDDDAHDFPKDGGFN
jgi:hypothetical protein